MQILIPEHLYESNEPYDLVWATVEFVNAAFEMLYRPEELPAAALQAYYVDFYLQQVNNGGHGQFVYDTRWDPMTVHFVASGMDAMGATEQRALFDRVASAVEALGDGLAEYLDSGYFEEECATRDVLDAFDEEFHALEDERSLIGLNRAFIAEQDLLSLPPSDMAEAMAELAEAVPEREARIEEAQKLASENEPAEAQLARLLCEKAEQELETITAVDYDSWEGVPAMRIHLSTDMGYHVIVIVPGKAMLVRGDTTDVIAEVELEQPEETS